MEQREIKPCPFCNSFDLSTRKKSRGWRVYVHHFYIVCMTCGCCGPHSGNSQGAIINWNNRKSSPGNKKATTDL